MGERCGGRGKRRMGDRGRVEWRRGVGEGEGRMRRSVGG